MVAVMRSGESHSKHFIRPDNLRIQTFVLASQGRSSTLWEESALIKNRSEKNVQQAFTFTVREPRSV